MIILSNGRVGFKSQRCSYQSSQAYQRGTKCLESLMALFQGNGKTYLLCENEKKNIQIRWKTNLLCNVEQTFWEVKTQIQFI